MKKRDDHVINKGDEAIFLDLLIAKTDGGFFRSGECHCSAVVSATVAQWLESMLACVVYKAGPR
jgi:hypothetical protein